MAGAGMVTGGCQVRPSVERLTKIVGTLTEGSRGIEETSHVWCVASNATEASLTRWNGLPSVPAVAVRPGSWPSVHDAPPSVDVANPMSVAPPLKKRPVWNAL